MSQEKKWSVREYGHGGYLECEWTYNTEDEADRKARYEADGCGWGRTYIYNPEGKLVKIYQEEARA